MNWEIAIIVYAIGLVLSELGNYGFLLWQEAKTGSEYKVRDTAESLAWWLLIWPICIICAIGIGIICLIGYGLSKLHVGMVRTIRNKYFIEKPLDGVDYRNPPRESGAPKARITV